MKIKPSEDEIYEVLNQVAEQIDKGGSRFRGMSFEQGVQDGINWVLGETEENPYPPA
jgi:hypothetical protein